MRQRLHSGQNVYGTLIVSPSAHVVPVAAKMGLDFVFIDTEHVPADREHVAWMCRAYQGAGIVPVVRVPSPDAYEACKMFDAGAGGVMVPYVETVEQVQAVVGAARWRPLKGRRLAEALVEPATAQPELRSYLDQRNAGSMVIINIESVPAMEKLDQLVRVPGVDAVVIGPHDLSCSLGLPEQYMHPRFDEAVRSILATTRAAGVGAGIHLTWDNVEQEIAWGRAGANLILHNSDLGAFQRTIGGELALVRRGLGDAAGAVGGETVTI